MVGKMGMRSMESNDINVSVVFTRNLIQEIKPFLVDVPVSTKIWIRPECQRKQFEVIRQARPSILFLQSDGGRNEREWGLIRENRRLFDENIDWDCEVHKLYATKNLGMYTMGEYKKDYIFDHVDRIVELEDDHIPAVSFFYFCKEMLDQYEDDFRINAICGMNHLEIYDEPNADYFFSRGGSIWGIAYWKRTYDSMRVEYANDIYTIREVCNIASEDSTFQKEMVGYAKKNVFNGHIPGTEFFLNLNMYANNQLFIIPKRNMISCVLYESGATHGTDDIRKLSKGEAQIFNMKTYELEGEIKHPKYVFPDLTYEKKLKRIIAWHHPVIQKYRRTVSIIKRFYYGEGKILVKKGIQKLKRFGRPQEEK